MSKIFIIWWTNFKQLRYWWWFYIGLCIGLYISSLVVPYIPITTIFAKILVIVIGILMLPVTHWMIKDQMEIILEKENKNE